jgi:hypothetical protein
MQNLAENWPIFAALIKAPKTMLASIAERDDVFADPLQIAGNIITHGKVIKYLCIPDKPDGTRCYNKYQQLVRKKEQEAAPSALFSLWLYLVRLQRIDRLLEDLVP